MIFIYKIIKWVEFQVCKNFNTLIKKTFAEVDKFNKSNKRKNGFGL